MLFVEKNVKMKRTEIFLPNFLPSLEKKLKEFCKHFPPSLGSEKKGEK